MQPDDQRPSAADQCPVEVNDDDPGPSTGSSDFRQKQQQQQEGHQISAHGRLDFEDHEASFKDRSTSDLCKSLTILRLCGVETLARNSMKMSRVTRAILGRWGHEKLLKMTVYGHFVAGDSERMIEKTLTKLRTRSIRAMIACPNEEDVGDADAKSETKYDACVDRTLECIRMAAIFGKDVPKAQIKVTGAMPTDLLLKLGSARSVEATMAIIEAISKKLRGEPLKIPDGSDLHLDDEEFGQLDRGIARLKAVGERARDLRVGILVDAEYVSVNPAISLLTMAMMYAFNRPEAFVWNTYQCYLKDAHENVRRDLDIGERLGVHFAAKIVRGAYLDKERTLAKLGSYPDPTNQTYADTNAMYNGILMFFIEHIARNPNECSIVVATHNEESVQLAIRKLEEAGIAVNNDSVTFAQLYGMCDQITYPLAQRGYGVYKSMPFGPVDVVMPYLHRRAMENMEVLRGSRKEVQLLKAEVARRFKKSIGLRQ